MTRPAPHIDADLVHRLVAEQFPQWSDLPVRPVQSGGWDNRTFHLGDRMFARLPSAAGYSNRSRRSTAGSTVSRQPPIASAI